MYGHRDGQLMGSQRTGVVLLFSSADNDEQDDDDDIDGEISCTQNDAAATATARRCLDGHRDLDRHHHHH